MSLLREPQASATAAVHVRSMSDDVQPPPASCQNKATKKTKSKRLSWTLGRKKSREEAFASLKTDNVADRSGECSSVLSGSLSVLTSRIKVNGPARRVDDELLPPPPPCTCVELSV